MCRISNSYVKEMQAAMKATLTKRTLVEMYDQEALLNDYMTDILSWQDEYHAPSVQDKLDVLENQMRDAIKKCQIRIDIMENKHPESVTIRGKELRVDTVLGTLVATDVTNDHYFKGIEINLEYKGVRSGCGVWMEVDSTISPPVLKLHLYDTKHDEPIQSINISKFLLNQEHAMLTGE